MELQPQAGGMAEIPRAIDSHKRVVTVPPTHQSSDRGLLKLDNDPCHLCIDCGSTHSQREVSEHELRPVEELTKMTVGTLKAFHSGRDCCCEPRVDRLCPIRWRSPARTQQPPARMNDSRRDEPCALCITCFHREDPHAYAIFPDNPRWSSRMLRLRTARRPVDHRRGGKCFVRAALLPCR